MQHKKTMHIRRSRFISLLSINLFKEKHSQLNRRNIINAAKMSYRETVLCRVAHGQQSRCATTGEASQAAASLQDCEFLNGEKVSDPDRKKIFYSCCCIKNKTYKTRYWQNKVIDFFFWRLFLFLSMIAGQTLSASHCYLSFCLSICIPPMNAWKKQTKSFAEVGASTPSGTSL